MRTAAPLVSAGLPVAFTMVVVVAPFAVLATGAAEPPARHVVEMRSFAFSPAELEVAVGDTVVWTNRDAAPHTATESSGRWDSGAMEAGASWSLVAAEPGGIAYHCEYHPSMRGALIVRASPEPTLETESNR